MELDLYHKKSKVLFGWTPKSGCTVVHKMFLDHCGLLEEALAYNENVHRFRGKYLRRCPVSERRRFVRIKFVRNPYSRAVSSYLHVCVHRKAFLERIQHVDPYPMFQHLDHLSFESFLGYLASGTALWDGHFQKQFRRGEDYMEIVRIESMDQVMPLMNQKYGLRLNWKFTCSHHIVKQPSMVTEYQGAKDFSKGFDEIGSYKQFYNETNRRLVETIYADDFLHYRYTYEDFLNENV